MSLRMIESIKRLRVTPTQKLVLFCLADCHNNDTGRCDPSYAHIMQITGLSNRAVATALHALRNARVLQFDSRNGWRTSYQITPPLQDAANPASNHPGASHGGNEAGDSLSSSASPAPLVSPSAPHAGAASVRPPMPSPTAATRARTAPAAPPPVNVPHSPGVATREPDPATCERGSLPPVNVLHRYGRPPCEPAAATCEHGSLPPVNVLHGHGTGSSEPAAQTCEAGSAPPVKEVHINRKEPEETGSTGGRPPRTDRLSEMAATAAAETPPQNLKPRREDWRDWHRQQARKANAVNAPLHAPAEFAESWTRYRDYRTRRATEARISSESVAWTLDAAEAALRMCERHAATHGWPAVVAQVDAAIHARWQGLHFQNTTPHLSKAHVYANSRPTPARSDSANAPGRYA